MGDRPPPAVTTGAVCSPASRAAAWACTEGSGAAICAYASTPGCRCAIWSAYSIPATAGRVGGVRAAPRRARSSAMRANSRWEIAPKLLGQQFPLLRDACVSARDPAIRDPAMAALMERVFDALREALAAAPAPTTIAPPPDAAYLASLAEYPTRKSRARRPAPPHTNAATRSGRTARRARRAPGAKVAVFAHRARRRAPTRRQRSEAPAG